MLAECVVNISEGRRPPVLTEVVAAAAGTLLDIHTDATHNRSVLTLGGPLADVEEAARQVVRAAVARIDLTHHDGVHPRFGAADVVPFADPVSPWGAPPVDELVAARDRLARWAGVELDLPCFLYGPERSLPEVRRTAFTSRPPDTGPPQPHPTAGACAVGARPVLVAYNLWLAATGTAEVGGDRPDPPTDPADGGDRGALALARVLAAELRGPELRTLGLAVPGGAQVSVNILGPGAPSPAALFDAVAGRTEGTGYAVERAELVGLIPDLVLRRTPPRRWGELDLGEDRTIEGRLAAKGDAVSPGPG